MLSHPLNKLFLAIAIAILWVLVWFFLRSGNNQETLKADASYAAGEKATTIGEREKAFNQALALYNELETKHHPSYGSGKLYFNLGNTYYQLGEYPMAVWNYYRALALMPRDQKVQANLGITRKKLGMAEAKAPSVFEKVFFIHYYFSLPERLQLFFAISLILLASCSWYLWTKKNMAQTAIVLSLIAALIVLSSLLYSRYISPLEGVMVQAANLYRDAGFQYAKVQDQPLLGGAKVIVLEVSPNGKWLKVTTEDGHVGYVPQDSIRLIQ